MFNWRALEKIIEAILLGVLFWVWSTSYLWPSIGIGFIARITDIIWLLLIIVAFLLYSKYRGLIFKWIPFGLYFTIILLLAFLMDYEHPYKIELYSKTMFFIIVSPLIGALLVAAIYGDNLKEKIFSKVLVIMSMLFIVGYFVFALNKGWDIRSTILLTELRYHYQGIGRLMAFTVLTLVGLRYYSGYLHLFLAAPIAVLITASFKSLGGLVGLLIGFGWLLLHPEYKNQYLTIKGKGYKWLTVMTIILIIVLSTYIFVNFGMDAIHRFEAKIKGQENRPTLMIEGLKLWLSSAKSFLFGPGILAYACHMNYCGPNEYRHPHNLIILILVWFGIFGLPLILILWKMITACYNAFYSKNAITYLFALLFIYYLFLSMIGGDLEQNRHLFLVGGAIVTLKRIRQKEEAS